MHMPTSYCLYSSINVPLFLWFLGVLKFKGMIFSMYHNMHHVLFGKTRPLCSPLSHLIRLVWAPSVLFPSLYMWSWTLNEHTCIILSYFVNPTVILCAAPQFIHLNKSPPPFKPTSSDWIGLMHLPEMPFQDIPSPCHDTIQKSLCKTEILLDHSEYLG